MIVGVCGKMGVGKDYIASKYILPYLSEVQNKRVVQLSFADQLKVNVMTQHNIPFDGVFVKKSETTRTLLQEIGTARGRKTLGDDVWIRYFDAWAKVHQSRGAEAIVCCDVRFPNEMKYIQSLGGIVVKVKAPTRNKNRLEMESNGCGKVMGHLQCHESEVALDGLAEDDFDIVINNDSDELLKWYLPHMYAVLKSKFP